MKRADRLIDKYFLEKFRQKKEKYVGAEIEMPLIHLNKTPVGLDFVCKMWDTLRTNHGFLPCQSTEEGIPFMAEEPGGDVISFDTTFNTVEFSMARQVHIGQMAKRFYAYLETLQKLAKEHKYLFCGTGINPYAQYADTEPLHTPSMLAKADFLKNYTRHHDGKFFHAFSASTQTHLDVDYEELPEVLNTLGKLSFVDCLLFANSLPLPVSMRCKVKGLEEVPEETICFRDILWEKSDAPNTGAFDGEYSTTEEIARHLKSLRVFIVTGGETGFRAIRPVVFEDYFNDQHHPEEDMVCFRPLEPSAPSRFGTIEIRSTCTQPLMDVFQPIAFFTGIAEAYGEARNLVENFLQQTGIHMAPSALRKKAALGAFDETTEVRTLLVALVDLAEKALINRGFGEEVFLQGIKERNDILDCPAKVSKQKLEQGG